MAGRSNQIAGVVLLVALVGCAKGVQDDSEVEEPGSADRDMSASEGGDKAGGDDGAPDASVSDDATQMGDPCSQGAAEPCTCDDGGEGERSCRFDSSSPLDGYFTDCSACTAPPGDDADDDQEDACADGMKNGFETGTDCGGPDCDPCGLDQGCLTIDDCSAGECMQGICTMPEEPEPLAGSGASGSGSAGSGSAGSGAAGSAGGSPPPPPPTPDDCRTTPSICTGTFSCCKMDGTCGSGVAPFCF